MIITIYMFSALSVGLADSLVLVTYLLRVEEKGTGHSAIQRPRADLCRVHEAPSSFFHLRAPLSSSTGCEIENFKPSMWRLLAVVSGLALAIRAAAHDTAAPGYAGDQALPSEVAAITWTHAFDYCKGTARGR